MMIREVKVPENKEESAALFHRLWGKAKAGPEYNSAEWRAMHLLLIEHGLISDANRGER